MDFLQSATDDQIALLACSLGFVLSAGAMYVSYFFGPKNRVTKRLPATQREAIAATTSVEQGRKAA